MKGLKIQLKADWSTFIARCDSVVRAYGKYEKGVYVFSILYDADNFPLTLSAKANENDIISVNREYRNNPGKFEVIS